MAEAARHSQEAATEAARAKLDRFEEQADMDKITALAEAAAVHAAEKEEAAATAAVAAAQTLKEELAAAIALAQVQHNEELRLAAEVAAQEHEVALADVRAVFERGMKKRDEEAQRHTADMVAQAREEAAREREEALEDEHRVRMGKLRAEMLEGHEALVKRSNEEREADLERFKSMQAVQRAQLNEDFEEKVLNMNEELVAAQEIYLQQKIALSDAHARDRAAARIQKCVRNLQARTIQREIAQALRSHIAKQKVTHEDTVTAIEKDAADNQESMAARFQEESIASAARDAEILRETLKSLADEHAAEKAALQNAHKMAIVHDRAAGSIQKCIRKHQGYKMMKTLMMQQTALARVQQEVRNPCVKQGSCCSVSCCFLSFLVFHARLLMHTIALSTLNYCRSRWMWLSPRRLQKAKEQKQRL